MRDPRFREGEHKGRIAALEASVLAAMQSRVARVAGLIAGIVALALLIARLIDSVGTDASSFDGRSVASLAVALAAFGTFHWSAVLSLRIAGGSPAAKIWASSQIAKYLPAPGAAVAGMMHATVAGGATVRQALTLATRHSAVLLGAAMIAGAPALGALTARYIGAPRSVAAVFAAVLGIGIIETGARTIPPRARRSAGFLALVGWLVLGTMLALAVAGDVSRTTIAAFPAAWAIGFLALPIPAGIGVRELMLVVLLEDSIGKTDAIEFGIISRALHVASDAAVALMLIPSRRTR